LVSIPALVWILFVFGLKRVDGVVLINDHVVFALSLFGLAQVVSSMVQVVVTALRLKFRKQRVAQGPLNVEAGIPYRTGYVLGRVHWNPLVKVDLAWERPTEVSVQGVPGRGGLQEEATAVERAYGKEIVRRIGVTDILGLARITLFRRLDQPHTILPHCGQVKTLQLLAQDIPGDQCAHPEGQAAGDFIEMRRYVPGDPLKLVLWKVYARTGRMLVRMPERAVSPCEKTLAYLVAAEGDEAAAGITRAVLENGSLGSDFLFGADGAESPTQDIREAVASVARSANARELAGRGLASFLAAGEKQGIRACLLFVPGRIGPWLGHVAAQMRCGQGPFRVLIGVDGIRRTRRGRMLRKLLLRDSDPSLSQAAEVRQICERLRPLASEVRIIQRTTGTILWPQEL
jgi:hypothetical protein